MASDAGSEAAGAAGSLTFHEFLERMKNPAAADLVRRIRSFMVSFMNKEPEPDKDGESVQGFYRSTEAMLATHPLWKGATEEELESSGEALERYLMIKLMPKAFCPAKDEAERDEQLSLKIAALQHFLQPKHLDISESLHNDASWLMAEKELHKMASFKAPKDKLQCILNCCRIVNNLLLSASISQAATTPASTAGGKSAGDDENVKPPGADDFLPVLIYVLVKANPSQLLSNLLFIQRYRNASRLTGEPSYFYTNVVSAASFLESVTASQLSIDREEYERLMEEGTKLAEEKQQSVNIVSDSTPIGQPGNPATEAGPHDGVRTTNSSKHGQEGTHARVSTPAQQVPKERVVTVEALQQRPEVVAQVLRADASGELGRQFRFLYAKEGDIRVGDVPELLNGYKDLALKYYALCRAVHGAQLVLDSTPRRPETQPAQQQQQASGLRGNGSVGPLDEYTNRDSPKISSPEVEDAGQKQEPEPQGTGEAPGASTESDPDRKPETEGTATEAAN